VLNVMVFCVIKFEFVLLLGIGIYPSELGFQEQLRQLEPVFVIVKLLDWESCRRYFANLGQLSWKLLELNRNSPITGKPWFYRLAWVTDPTNLTIT
jgi:hypothetical protein